MLLTNWVYVHSSFSVIVLYKPFDDVSYPCTAACVVAVSRKAESLADFRQKLGNATEDKLMTVQGNLSEWPEVMLLQRVNLMITARHWRTKSGQYCSTNSPISG